MENKIFGLVRNGDKSIMDDRIKCVAFSDASGGGLADVEIYTPRTLTDIVDMYIGFTHNATDSVRCLDVKLTCKKGSSEFEQYDSTSYLIMAENAETFNSEVAKYLAGYLPETILNVTDGVLAYKAEQEKGGFTEDYLPAMIASISEKIRPQAPKEPAVIKASEMPVIEETPSDALAPLESLTSVSDIMDILKTARKKRNISQQELGSLIDVKGYDICAFETGRRIPSNEIIVKIANCLMTNEEKARVFGVKSKPEAKPLPKVEAPCSKCESSNEAPSETRIAKRKGRAAAIGEDVKCFRKNAGLTQQEVARQLGVSQNLISRWERGKMRPSKSLQGKFTRMVERASSAVC